MTPKRLLSLWRERWGKTNIATRMQPYIDGELSDWGERVCNSEAWSLPGLGSLAVILFAGLTLLLVSVRFTLPDQLWFSIFLLTLSLLIRRYQAQVMVLMLAGFSIISSSRYLYWRFDETLGTPLTTDFFVALVVLMIEVYGVTLFALNIARAIWPSKQPYVALPEDVTVWPTVSVIVYGAGRTADDIAQSISSLQAVEWPHRKLNITVVDAIARESLHTPLTAEKISYLAYPDEIHGAAGLLNRAMAQSGTELAVIIMAGQTPAGDFLMQSIGWFHSDPGLGLLCTPNHFLMPEPHSSYANRILMDETQPEILIMRIDLCVKSGGIPIEPLSTSRHLARHLQKNGFGHAYMVFNNDSMWRIHEPFAGRSLFWRLRLERLNSAFQNYRFILSAAMLIVPLLYLLANIEPVKMTPMLWMAYALPHLVLAYLLKTRVQSTLRLPIWLEIREAFQSIYLLLLTFISVISTQFRQRKNTSGAPLDTIEMSEFQMSRSDWILSALHGSAILIGVFKLTQIDKASAGILIFFLVWSSVVILLLTAKFAVAKEVLEVAWQKQQLRTMPAMIRLPNNRTATCQTINFPSTHLEISVPTSLPLIGGQEVKLSIFHQRDEYAFPAVVSKRSDSSLTLDINPSFQEQYTQFSQAVFARGPDWPSWLPGQYVDRIIPHWLINLVSLPFVALTHLTHRLAKKPISTLINADSMKWKKKA